MFSSLPGRIKCSEIPHFAGCFLKNVWYVLMLERQGQRNGTIGHRAGKTLLGHGVRSMLSYPCLHCFKSNAVVYPQHMCCKAVPGPQLFSVKKRGRKAVGLVSLVLQQKTEPCGDAARALPPAPTGIILPGEVSSLPKEHKSLLIFMPEFYIGHLGWRNVNLSLSSVSAETSTEWRLTSVCRRQLWFRKNVESIISS